MNHLFRVARDDTSHHNTYYTATGLQDTVLALQSKSCQTSKGIKYSYIEQIKTRKHATCSINMVSPCIFGKKNYSSQTQLMYNSVPVSNESFVQRGKG